MSDTPHIASCIPLVPGTKFLKVREDLVETLGDHCLAGLVQVCIGWYDYHSASPERILRVTAAFSEKYGTVPVDVTRAFYLSVNQAEKAMLGLYKQNKIIESLKKLEDTGLLEKVENPFPDEVRCGVNWYAFHPAILARMIHEKYGVRFIRTDEGYLKTNTPPIGKPTGGVGKPTGGCWKTNNILDSSLDHTETTSDTLKQKESPKIANTQPDVWSQSFVEPTDEQIEKYRILCNTNGAGYGAKEWRLAVLALKSRGWCEWGTEKPVRDWRAAIERQIGWDIGHNVGVNEDEEEPEPEKPSWPQPVPGKPRDWRRMFDEPAAALATWTKEETDSVLKEISDWTTVYIPKYKKMPDGKEKQEYMHNADVAMKACREFLEKVKRAKEKVR